MSALDPANTTIGDLVTECLHEAGALGVGQTALAEDANRCWARLQWMLQQWERKRWLVYHLVTYNKTSTGALSYSLGPGGDLDTGAGTVRPARIESAFLRQLTQSAPNQIDYPLQQLQSREDYNLIRLKTLQSFPQFFFYDTDWPLGHVFAWPVPQANIYGLFVSVLEQLPVKFVTLATKIALPYEYYAAILYNGALRLRPAYQLATYPGDPLPALAKDALNVLRGANTQIAALQVPADLRRPGPYNIFSDTNY